MHGRPRKVQSEEEQEESAVKAKKLRALQSQFLQFHHSKTYTKEAIEISTKLLELNPEYYTAWNYRKLAIEHYLSGASDRKTDEESIKSILDEELKVVENALRRNYKSYGAWHHRKWVLNKGHSSTDHELMLLAKFQKEDSRNFHAWNYRRFVTSLKNVPAQEELQYTTNMICDNFSNYSAWHNRSVILSYLLKEKVEGYFPKENVLTEEYEFVRNALFTDPDDQSGWFYHLWLLDQTVTLEFLSVSSWPPHGSNFYLSVDGLLDCCAPTPSLLSDPETFPLILYFSEAVKGINSSTVAVECEYDTNNDLIWRPIQANKSGQAHVWLAYLNFPTEKAHPSKQYQVKASIGHSPGIISSSGVCCSHSSCIVFTVCVSPSNSKYGQQHHREMIDWGEEIFCFPETHDFGFVNSLYQLKITEDLKAYERNIDIIAGEIAYCQELLSEMDCKIGKLTLARLLMAHDALISCNGVNDQKTSCYKEVLELYQDLMILDPPHWQYYKDQHSLVFLRQEISDKESLLKYCRRYRGASSPTTNNYACLRLNNLSLSRIGCTERLLWVQMLDLSYNELRSIEGLEALQLLCCLNLGNNKLCNFSALEPLKQLKSLKVLDISCNEIGAHSIDTRRYLFASPLSHIVGNDCNGEFSISGAEMTNYWEAFTVFRALNLTQLAIKGNPISDENLKSFFCKLLPKLKWFDGEELQ